MKIGNLNQNHHIPRDKELKLKKLKKACTDFEAIFVGQLLKEMRKTVHKEGFIDGGNAEKIFTSMLDDEYAKELAKDGNLGLADMLFKQLKSHV
jgi:flagellar protein FlgJ